MEKVIFTPYIKKILKCHYEGVTISKKASFIIDSIIKVQLETFTVECKKSSIDRATSTISIEDIKYCLRMMIPSDLQPYANGKILKACEMYKDSCPAKTEKTSTSKTHTSRSRKAGLILPISRVEKYVKKFIGNTRVTKMFLVAMTAFLEYISEEILDGTYEEAASSKKSILTTIHLYKSISKDECIGAIIKPEYVFS